MSMTESSEKKKKKETNIKETIESILVAFILAFIFRCFVVEAFVIPTGSMAPTLLGAHMDFRCTYCGYHYSCGYNSQTNDFAIDEFARGKVYGMFCPNCGLQVPEQDAADPYNDATAPLLKYGDRILVMKYIYLLNDPTRWDVVVFKSPETATGDYSVNYIKRLVGKPGESLFVAQGDLYVAEPGADKNNIANYHVQTKPRWAQDALWRIVFDGDYIPDLTKKDSSDKTIQWQHPWRKDQSNCWFTGDNEKNVSARQFLFDGTTKSGSLFFDPSANPNKGSMTDWLAYDQSTIVEGSPNVYSRQASYATSNWVNNVSDLKLAATIDSLEGSGSARFILGKGKTEFTGEVFSDKVRLFKTTDGQETLISEVKMPIVPNTRIALQNVDYQVTLLVNDKEVIQTTPAQYSPKMSEVVGEIKQSPVKNTDGDLQSINIPPASTQGSARIEGFKSRFKLSHLQLWRDVYYQDHSGGGLVLRAYANNFPRNVQTLKPHEFFVMGDNSFCSLDARLWKQSINLKESEDLTADAGVVPERFMLGRAFFVYWPAGYRPTQGVPAVVPNFGEMRFIR